MYMVLDEMHEDIHLIMTWQILLKGIVSGDVAKLGVVLGVM